MELVKPFKDRPALWLLRSDAGDGGWSLHTKECVKEAEEHDDVPVVLLSGTADWDGQEWDRPSRSDFNEAYNMLSAKN